MGLINSSVITICIFLFSSMIVRNTSFIKQRMIEVWSGYSKMSNSSKLNYQSKENDMLKLKNREFKVTESYIKGSFQTSKLECFLEIETEEQDFEDEIWQPSIKHQGLIFDFSTWEELQGTTLQWTSGDDESYKHPEVGSFYVFDHVETKNNIMKFGEISNGEIEFSWSGVADIYWDDEFDVDVPFLLETKLTIMNE